MANILEIQNLSKNFQGLKAVSNVSFTVSENSITGIIGSNGAGKTTVFNMISGVLLPSEGTITYCGNDITGTKAHKYSGLGIARTFQIMKPLRNMTVCFPAPCSDAKKSQTQKKPGSTQPRF